MAEEAKEWFGHFQKAATEIKELRARLAAVEALCDQWEAINGGTLIVHDIRAAARGEGDRPAEVPHEYEPETCSTCRVQGGHDRCRSYDPAQGWRRCPDSACFVRAACAAAHGDDRDV